MIKYNPGWANVNSSLLTSGGSMFKATILADSISPYGADRLTTMEITFPRIVLSEFNTHRMFSRNSASSRAIPALKQLERLLNDPFIPFFWGKNQKGMQADTELTGDELAVAVSQWLDARDDTTRHATALLEMEVHKQLTNRLMEPFMWHTVIVTATEWNNFFALRANPNAQPEIRKIAEMMREAHTGGFPQFVNEGEWHLPLIQTDEFDGTFEYTDEARMISAARCARVSYLTHDGVRSHEADLKLFDRLVTGGHMSPLEHVATPFTRDQERFRGDLMDYARQAAQQYSLHEEDSERVMRGLAFDGNFRGWTQLRKTIPGEFDFSLVS